jgi:hypothetical protein
MEVELETSELVVGEVRRVGTRYSLAPSGDDCNNTGVSTSVNSTFAHSHNESSAAQ